jgi:hypothetical protein
MEKWFEVDELEAEMLLAEWHWLCPSRFSLVARNVFGELFLQDETGLHSLVLLLGSLGIGTETVKEEHGTTGKLTAPYASSMTIEEPRRS